MSIIALFLDLVVDTFKTLDLSVMDLGMDPGLAHRVRPVAKLIDDVLLSPKIGFIGRARHRRHSHLVDIRTKIFDKFLGFSEVGVSSCDDTTLFIVSFIDIVDVLCLRSKLAFVRVEVGGLFEDGFVLILALHFQLVVCQDTSLSTDGTVSKFQVHI
jgi:hypothetical protein